MAAERGVTLPTAYFHHTQGHHVDGLLYNTMPRSLADCFQMFAEISQAVNDLTALRTITREALQDFATHAVVYVELRSTPQMLVTKFRQSDMATKRDYVETILQVMQEVEDEEEERYRQESKANKDNVRLPIQCRFLVCRWWIDPNPYNKRPKMWIWLLHCTQQKTLVLWEWT